MHNAMAEQLSCDACRRSKTRCSKEKPTCAKCHSKGYECVYHPRAQRTRRKNPLKSVLERLQHLEEHGAVRRPPRELIPKLEQPPPPPPMPLSQQQSDYRSPSKDAALSQSPVASLSSVRSIYITPESTTSTGMWTKEASDKVRDVTNAPNDPISLDIDRETAQRWLDLALAKNMFFRFLGLIDLEILKAMPGLIDSGYVRFDPSVLLIYYMLLYQGSYDDELPRVCYWRHRIFRHCLNTLPDFTQSAKLTDMDFTASFLVLWTSIGAFNNLSHWNLFCQTCHIATQLGIHDLESHPEDGDDTIKDDTRRILFWQLLRMECWFRAFLNKPPVLTAKPWNVNLPSVSINGAWADAMDATLATICMLHAKLTLVITDCCKITDDENKSQGEARASMEKAIEQIRGLVVDWQMEESFEKVPGAKHKFFYADPLIFSYCLIIQLVRKIGIHAHPKLLNESRRYARRILAIMIMLGEGESPIPEYRGLTLSIVSANPYIPFFHLRDAAIADTDRETARQDFDLLEAWARFVLDGVTAQGFHMTVPYAQHLCEISRDEGLHISPVV
ncbi:hypothetical protein K461DRAFT_20997 [Myriangium duriaei CBS 260.36]|uniref:Zn(2)-C6 fungal-type domain-containing protein n=1 Tax=Myriangium duriaei CBS 260.36 TaxID=1168546 RepID=A0A9P4MLS0_9PEZI|nr:hypothetical protein K461DRAFT_20997 [Myriangium duriaei CBS 260.36]